MIRFLAKDYIGFFSRKSTYVTETNTGTMEFSGQGVQRLELTPKRNNYHKQIDELFQYVIEQIKKWLISGINRTANS